MYNSRLPSLPLPHEETYNSDRKDNRKSERWDRVLSGSGKNCNSEDKVSNRGSRSPDLEYSSGTEQSSERAVALKRYPLKDFFDSLHTSLTEKIVQHQTDFEDLLKTEASYSNESLPYLELAEFSNFHLKKKHDQLGRYTDILEDALQQSIEEILDSSGGRKRFDELVSLGKKRIEMKDYLMKVKSSMEEELDRCTDIRRRYLIKCFERRVDDDSRKTLSKLLYSPLEEKEENDSIFERITNNNHKNTDFIIQINNEIASLKRRMSHLMEKNTS